MNDRLSEPAVSIKNIVKTFNLPHDRHSGIKQAVLNIGKGERAYESQRVLNGLSFEINEGEFFGIVGRNGSGKSTLLKILAGIYSPDSGSVRVNGSLIPFIELGVGFNPELTGRENVYLNGALLGFSRKEMGAMYSDVVDFAELEKFMDQKLKNYSSGMQVRLAFSIAIRANADILLLDEVLAVGDEAFQRKCYNYFAQLKKAKKTVILVTHSMDAVQQFCDKAIMIEKGRIVAEGNPAKVAQTYRELFVPMPDEQAFESSGSTKGDIDITGKVENIRGIVKLSVELMPNIDIRDCILTLFLDRDTGEQVYRFASDERIGESFNLKQGKKIKLSLEVQDIFPNGIFNLRASVKSRDRTIEYVLAGNLGSFEIDRRISSGSQWDIHWQPNEKFILE